MTDERPLTGRIVPAEDGPAAEQAAAELTRYLLEVDERHKRERRPNREDDRTKEKNAA